LPPDGVHDNHVISSSTAHDSVPHPVFKIVNEFDPDVFGKFNEVGETVNIGVVLGAWEIEMVFGLPEAPVAVTVMIPVLTEQAELAS
jgi:hypothetical protein